MLAIVARPWVFFVGITEFGEATKRAASTASPQRLIRQQVPYALDAYGSSVEPRVVQLVRARPLRGRARTFFICSICLHL